MDSSCVAVPCEPGLKFKPRLSPPGRPGAAESASRLQCRFTESCSSESDPGRPGTAAAALTFCFVRVGSMEVPPVQSGMSESESRSPRLPGWGPAVTPVALRVVHGRIMSHPGGPAVRVTGTVTSLSTSTTVTAPAAGCDRGRRGAH
jgi:hypothetical protein